MAPIRTSIHCVVCKEQPKKYKCPECGAPYCSVACYKTHKTSHEASNSNVPQEDTPQEASSSNVHPSLPVLPPLFPANTLSTSTIHTTPLRPLTDLSWPSEPDPSIFQDPLRKDEPRPLRVHDYQVLASDVELRRILAPERAETLVNGKTGNLRELLSALKEWPEWKRKEYITKLLSVDQEWYLPMPSPTASQRKTDPAVESKSTASASLSDMGKQHNGKPALYVSPQDTLDFRAFAQAVRQALDGADSVASGRAVELEM